MLNYEALGIEDKYRQHLNELRRISGSFGFYNELLLAHYFEIMSLLNQSKYREAKSHLRRSIRLANRLKLYHRLCIMYHLLSGVYYEEAQYQYALKHLYNSIRLATNLGLFKWAVISKLRISFIYQRMGYYEGAIRYAELVSRSSYENLWHSDYFNSLLQLFNIYIAMNSERALFYHKKLDRIARNSLSRKDWAFYRYYLGGFNYINKQYESSYKEYSIAKRLYDMIGYEDDSIRSALRMVLVCLEMGRYQEAQDLLRHASTKLKKMESNELWGEYFTRLLAYHYMRRSDISRLLLYTKKCEDILISIENVELYQELTVLLFRAFSRLGYIGKAMKYFRLYYHRMKAIMSQISQYPEICKSLRSGVFNSAVREYEIMAKRLEKM
jgi:tetratricopeptide (TPR) repeat protein